MFSWHTAHFALWVATTFSPKIFEWYQQTLPVARAIAAERGLRQRR